MRKAVRVTLDSDRLTRSSRLQRVVVIRELLDNGCHRPRRLSCALPPAVMAVAAMVAVVAMAAVVVMAAVAAVAAVAVAAMAAVTTAPAVAGCAANGV